MHYLEQIQVMHQQVREYVESLEPGYKVTSIDGYFTTEYTPPMHALDEQPKYVLHDIKARFHVYARDNFYRLACDVFVTSEGRLYRGDRLISI